MGRVCDLIGIIGDGRGRLAGDAELDVGCGVIGETNGRCGAPLTVVSASRGRLDTG